MQVLGYVRVSTDEQADSGAGLQAQRNAIEQECHRRSWRLVRTIEDAGYSARDLKRPGIQNALYGLANNEAGALVVAKLDRLSRSLLDFSEMMARAQDQGWAIVALDLGVDTSSAAGEAMANVMATFAQFERRLIGQRTREALAVKKAQGVRLGRPVSLDAVVQANIVDARHDGASYAEIADRLNVTGVPTAQGGERWWPATVRSVVRRVEREAA